MTLAAVSTLHFRRNNNIRFQNAEASLRFSSPILVGNISASSTLVPVPADPLINARGSESIVTWRFAKRRDGSWWIDGQKMQKNKSQAADQKTASFITVDCLACLAKSAKRVGKIKESPRLPVPIKSLLTLRSALAWYTKRTCALPGVAE